TSTKEKLGKLLKLTEGPYKAFLYDCDGTLADNMQSHKAAFVKVAAQHNIDLDDTIIDELAGWPTVLVAEEIIKRYNVKFDTTNFAKQKSSVYVEEFIEQTMPIAFVVEHLKSHVGKVKIGVVSGGSRSTVTKTLGVIGVDKYLDVLVCAGETERGKPYPDPFLKAAGILGVAPHECMVFEDGDPGVEAAERAGMKWVRVDKI
ncbi:MAG TPA: HAD family phosphatase, partial [Flavisolibacter sp.]|nr:HAD family phosphatase [Flavisolibacter sp.]